MTVPTGKHRHNRGTRIPKGERGSATLEMVILAPAMLLIVSVIIFGGRVALAGQAVQHAAEDAARTASIARTQGEADQTASAAARSALSQQGLECSTVRVSVDTSGFNAPIGTTGMVTATVECPVRVGDLAIPGLPGTRLVEATARSPIDAYRERR